MPQYCDIYSQLLFFKGYGYPLWYPEKPTPRQIHIGDVGWMNKGGFIPLFNSMKPKEHELNKNNVPDNFELLGKSLTDKSIDVIPKAIGSRGTIFIDVAGGNAGNAVQETAGGTAIFKKDFTYTGNIGALLLVPFPCVSEEIESQGHIKDYMRTCVDSWYKFATGLDGFSLPLSDEDLMFVSGTTKTTSWAVATFGADSNQILEGQGSAAFDLDPKAITPFSLKISDKPAPLGSTRTGRSPSEQVSSAGAEASHCVFIHYWKIKRRRSVPRSPWLPFSPRTHGASDDPKRARGGTSTNRGSGEADKGSASDELQWIDPVNHLLDYILNTSRAKVAIASDSDVIRVLKDIRGDIGDIRTRLVEAAPAIFVDKDGVGTVSDNGGDSSDVETVQEARESSSGSRRLLKLPSFGRTSRGS